MPMLRVSKILFIISISAVVILTNRFSYASLNDFDLSNKKINTQELLSGGPAKDGIPALTDPAIIPAGKAKYMKGNDHIVGVIINGKARAYPIKILNWHEIINDSFEEESIAVTWCPLTKSAVVFDRAVDGQILEFGVSGLLYNSNVAMYDRNHLGLWSQLKMGGLTGKLSSRSLSELPAIVTTWKDWRKKYPQTSIVSGRTGYPRNYNRNPYKEYHANHEVMFPVPQKDQRLASKDLVLGLKIKGVTKAYPLDIIQRLDQPLEDKVAGMSVRIHKLDNDSAYVTDLNNQLLPATIVYWFAWSTFYKDTLVYQPLL